METKIFLAVAAILGVARSEPPSTSYGTPLSTPLNSYGGQNYDGGNGGQYDYNGQGSHGGQGDHGDHGDHGDGEPKAYEFGYQVKDDYTGNNYNRKESSDGNQVKGEYRVLLPDGRTQIVTYYADWQTGFHADVRYEGTAHYPDQHNNNNNNYNGGYNGPDYAHGNDNGFGGGSASGTNGYSGGGYDSYSGGNKGRPGYEYGAP